ncbi:MAG TPA: hypothetical protein VL651_08275 [Bacteroidia bacterium]|jgi:ribosomal protein S18 acetylase RimI-like enzyme|nr:hypothetical protein [Bacteroidia bacterium]
MSDITIRRATDEDIPFLAKIILLSETSGSELYSYRTMFSDHDDNALLSGFERAFNNSVPGHPFSVSTYLVAEVDNKKVCAVSGYIESPDENSNDLITGALMDGFGTEAVLKAYQQNALQKETYIPRTPGTLQLSSGATLPGYRGLGVFSKVFYEHLAIAHAQGCTTAEFQAWLGNKAIDMYYRMGCELITEKKVILPDSRTAGKILMHIQTKNRPQ